MFGTGWKATSSQIIATGLILIYTGERNMRTYSTLFVTLSLIMSQNAFASVVMTGTRIIYPSQTREKSVQLRNMDNQPYIVQVDTDKGQKKSASDDGDFVVTPQIFRMEPNAGQSVRLMYTGKNLPQDREAIFYMNFTQLPATKAANQSGNQLVLSITNRVKIFYRPQGITGRQEDTAKNLTFRMDGKNIQVKNPGGYYASVRRASLIFKGREIRLADSVMVAPKSSSEWTPSIPVQSLKGAHLRLTLVNDYGMDTTSERTL